MVKRLLIDKADGPLLSSPGLRDAPVLDQDVLAQRLGAGDREAAAHPAEVTVDVGVRFLRLCGQAAGRAHAGGALADDRFERCILTRQRDIGRARQHQQQHEDGAWGQQELGADAKTGQHVRPPSWQVERQGGAAVSSSWYPLGERNIS